MAHSADGLAQHPASPSPDTGPQDLRSTLGTPWQELLAEADRVAARAYAPYSQYRVGAAGRADDGRTVSGCNVENAGLGVTLCAECGLVSQLLATGGGRLTHFVCVNGEGALITPCGRCRQLLWEFGGAALQVLTPLGVVALEVLLPQAFGPEELGH
ncbi:cytidine deaminase [Nocardioides yefusunii]|uniref:Cytidine deaminase n=1 Tax=Nocardioides yefusunii TaxID=2500546 RepID=A0ABW1R1A0_9ACTN|nr:cytidine deaminase [Nocardioides yefusunii]